MTLESRISRLEKLLRKKNESMGIDDIRDAADSWFDENLDSGMIDEEDYWVREAGGLKKFYRILKRKDADPIVDDCCMAIGVDEMSDDCDIVEDVLAERAANELKYL